MKRLNMFSTLPAEDKTLILNLCDHLPYKSVAERLARPRSEGGLALVTSPTSLCKFYTHHHPEAVAIQAIGQYSAALQVNHQAHGEAHFEAILSAVQTRLLAALRDGRPVAELDKEFRTLERVQKCFLADTKFREKNPVTQDAYLAHVKEMTLVPEADFVRTDVPNDPGAGGLTAEDFEEIPTQYELDLEFAEDLPNSEVGREPTFLRNAARVAAALRARNREAHYIAQSEQKANRAAEPASSASPLEQIKALLLQAAQRKKLETAAVSLPPHTEFPSPSAPDSPAIPHISPNFASPPFCDSPPSKAVA